MSWKVEVKPTAEKFYPYTVWGRPFSQRSFPHIDTMTTPR